MIQCSSGRPGGGELETLLSQRASRTFATSAGGSEASHRAAVIRCSLKPAETSENSHAIGGPMISGRSIFSRGHPDWSEIIGLSVGPPRHLHAYRDRAAFQSGLRVDDVA